MILSFIEKVFNLLVNVCFIFLFYVFIKMYFKNIKRFIKAIGIGRLIMLVAFARLFIFVSGFLACVLIP